MSRSRKKTPVTGITTAESEAEDKKIWHKRLRSKIKSLITATHNDADSIADTVFPNENDAINPWSMDKDGKSYFGKEFFSNKIPDWSKKAMRK